MAGAISYQLAPDPSREGPLSLQELSAITIGVDMWRSEANKSTSRSSKRFQPYCKPKSVKPMLPKTPRLINDIIKQYSEKFENSMKFWLKDLFGKAFKLRYNHQNDILNDFNDFVIDHTGAIHDIETAKRMVHCDRLSDDVKFVIACLYDFENDIRRIGKSMISAPMDFSKIDAVVQLKVQLYMKVRPIYIVKHIQEAINDLFNQIS